MRFLNMVLDFYRTVQGETLRPSKNTLLAEVGSLSLEFTRLTQLTGDPKYYDAIQRVSNELEKAQSRTRIPGLWPVMVDLDHLMFDDSRFTLGGMADSTYEYLPKEHILLGARTKQYQKMYEAAMKPINEKIFYRPMTKNGEDILFSGSLRAVGGSTGKVQAEAQHLTCFMGGVVGIGAKIFNRPEELSVARKLTDACIWAYDVMPTGLMPEVFYTVACENRDHCPWDEDEWVSELRRRAHYSGNSKDESAEEAEAVKAGLIAEAGLPPGISGVDDARYILR
jgi:mannosyl-oligosaccharide alpha-1,2-mannosidase